MVLANPTYFSTPYPMQRHTFDNFFLLSTYMANYAEPDPNVPTHTGMANDAKPISNL
jgi:hypothetical protein